MSITKLFLLGGDGPWNVVHGPITSITKLFLWGGYEKLEKIKLKFVTNSRKLRENPF